MSDDGQKRIFLILDEVRKDLGTLSREVGEVKVKLETRPFCPRPGACDNLEDKLMELHEEREQAETGIKTTIEQLKKDMGTLQTLVERVRGGWMTLSILAAAGGALGSVVTFFIQHK
jgi:hypothetical protein